MGWRTIGSAWRAWTCRISCRRGHSPTRPARPPPDRGDGRSATGGRENAACRTVEEILSLPEPASVLVSGGLLCRCRGLSLVRLMDQGCFLRSDRPPGQGYDVLP